MSTKKLRKLFSKHSSTKQENTVNEWDGAIREAERQIEEAKQRIATLKFTVKTFVHLKETGAPFPGEGAKQDEAGA